MEVQLAYFLNAILRPLQCSDRSNLDWGERSIIQIGLYLPQGCNQFAVSAHEADAPTRHVITLGQGEKLNRHIHGSGDLQDGRGNIPVKHQVGISQVMHHPNLVLPRHFHDLFEKIHFDALGGGIAGKV